MANDHCVKVMIIFPRTQCYYPLVCWLNLFPICVSVLKKFIRAGCTKYDVEWGWGEPGWAGQWQLRGAEARGYTVYTGDSREVTAELSIGISTTDIYYLLRWQYIYQRYLLSTEVTGHSYIFRYIIPSYYRYLADVRGHTSVSEHLNIIIADILTLSAAVRILYCIMHYVLFDDVSIQVSLLQACNRIRIFIFKIIPIFKWDLRAEIEDKETLSLQNAA